MRKRPDAPSVPPVPARLAEPFVEDWVAPHEVAVLAEGSRSTLPPLPWPMEVQIHADVRYSHALWAWAKAHGYGTPQGWTAVRAVTHRGEPEFRDLKAFAAAAGYRLEEM